MKSITYKPTPILKVSKPSIKKRSDTISITILQHKRVIAPYIFCNYIYPILKKIYNHKLELHIIQHIPRVSRANRNFLLSNSMPTQCLDIVSDWTQRGYFKNAIIHKHFKDFPDYPMMPSYLLGLEIVERIGSEFNLHLEDDSLVCDRGINDWKRIMSGYTLGAYAIHKYGKRKFRREYGESARCISTKKFRKNFLKFYEDIDTWNAKRTPNFSNQLELRTTRISNNRIKLLGKPSNSLKLHYPRLSRNQYLRQIKNLLESNGIKHKDFGIFEENEFIY